jgi:metal-responsive CopG/Arc/MetJ family transcriptional regulator
MSADDRTRTHSPSFDRRVTVRMDTQLVEDLETAAGDDSLSDVLRDAARAYVRGGRDE